VFGFWRNFLSGGAGRSGSAAAKSSSLASLLGLLSSLLGRLISLCLGLDLSASGSESGVCLESIQFGLSLGCLGLGLLNSLGLVTLGALSVDESGVTSESDELWQLLEVAAVFLGLLGSVDDSTGGYESGVLLEGGELGLGLDSFSLDLGDSLGVVSGLGLEPGLVGDKLNKPVEAVNLSADLFVAWNSGRVSAALGNNSGGENQRNEGVGELHVCGLKSLNLKVKS